jgi:hypothetical protein
LLPTLSPSPPLTTQFEIKTLLKWKYLPFPDEAQLSHIMVNGTYKNSKKEPESKNDRFKNSIRKDVG